VESPVDFRDTRWNDWCRQASESRTVWDRSGKHLDPNPD